MFANRYGSIPGLMWITGNSLQRTSIEIVHIDGFLWQLADVFVENKDRAPFLGFRTSKDWCYFSFHMQLFVRTIPILGHIFIINNYTY